MLRTETLHANFEAVLATESGKASPFKIHCLSSWIQNSEMILCEWEQIS